MIFSAVIYIITEGIVSIKIFVVMCMVKTECEIYSRVCGYLRPISNWNDSKQSEFSDRVMFDTITPDIYDAKV